MSRLLLLGYVLVGSVIAMALFAPLSPYAPQEINLNAVLLPPSGGHWFGTDALGRDVFTRMAYGAQISLLVGIVSVGISTALGIFFGALAGFYGRWVDTLIMRLVDIMLCFPSFFLILAVIAFLEPSIYNIMAVIGLTSWMGVARLVRAEFMKLRELDYISAAKLMKVSNSRIMWRHMLPNALPPVLVSATLGIAGAILVESGLSFLGIGVQPPTASWGNILTEGKANLDVAWWMSVFPGLAILLTVLGYNLLGEGLREKFDARLK